MHNEGLSGGQKNLDLDGWTQKEPGFGNVLIYIFILV